MICKQEHIKIFLQLSLLYITRPDYCFDQRNNFDLFWCNHLCSEDMFKCNDLFRGQLPVTKEQLEPVLFDAPTSIQRTTWSWEEVGETICSWTLDKLKHTKLSLVCLGFTSMNVPLCLKCPGPSAFRQYPNDRSCIWRPRLLGTMLCVPRLGGGGEEQVSAATPGSYFGGVVIS